jgi:predicted transposase YbfD/YdcC
MKYSVPTFDVNINPDGFVVDLGSLFAWLARLCDGRSPRGMRYALATVLVLVVLAKIAGEDHLSGIAEWVRYRVGFLTEALHWVKPRAPHRTTYSRILGHAVDVEAFEKLVGQFFARQSERGRVVVVNVDGKTLRGTIPAGQTQGLHLLAAYSPEEGWVLMQVEVEDGENEVTAAPRLLEAFDLRGKVITGDALLAQRGLSVQIVEGGGEYIWTVKENHPQLREDIATLFEPEECIKGFSPAVHGFGTAETREKGHGRMERRAITVSSELKGYVDWPYAEQVFKLERHSVRIRDGEVRHEVVYGVTSLTEEEAGPRQLLGLSRAHWGIENGLHYRRDETLREDWCHLRTGTAPRVMAIINNLVLGLLLRRGAGNVPQARRYYEAHLNDALQLVLRC